VDALRKVLWRWRDSILPELCSGCVIRRRKKYSDQYSGRLRASEKTPGALHLVDAAIEASSCGFCDDHSPVQCGHRAVRPQHFGFVSRRPYGKFRRCAASWALAPSSTKLRTDVGTRHVLTGCKSNGGRGDQDVPGCRNNEGHEAGTVHFLQAADERNWRSTTDPIIPKKAIRRTRWAC